MNNWKYREKLPVAAVDQDDTFFPLSEVFASKINTYFGIEFDVSKLEHIQNDTYLNERIQQLYGITEKDVADFQHWYNSKNFYMGVPSFDGSIEALKRLNEETNLFLLTSSIYPDMLRYVDQVMKFKVEYFREYLPFIDPTQYIMMDIKHLFDADIRIDDSYRQLKGEADLKYLMSTTANNKYTKEELIKINAIRVSNWPELMEDYELRKDIIKVKKR